MEINIDISFYKSRIVNVLSDRFNHLVKNEVMQWRQIEESL